MKFLVIGATGGIGGELVKQSLAGGHRVTALVRSPEKMKSESGLTVIKGDPLNAEELRSALEGQDAVFSALGFSGLGPTTLYPDFARTLVKAASDLSPRVVVVSAAVLFRDAGLIVNLVGGTFLRNTRAALTEMEEILAGSKLDWTAVRPPRLTDGPETHAYKTEIGHLPKERPTMSRADVADFMIEEAQRSGVGRRVIGLAG